jgi:hypothetical protein
MMRDRVRADLKRIESWPFIPSMNLRDVYSEASRILNDPGIPSKLKASAERMAPGSRLGLFFAREDWMSKNPRPSLPTPDNESYRQFRKMLDRYEADELDWLRQWPNDYASLRDLWSGVEVRASLGDQGAGSPEDLAVIDALIRFHSASPDVSIEDPPVETAIAQAYVAGKVRLGQVPNLLDAGLRAIEAQKKYEMSEDAEDEVMRVKYPRTRDSREFTRVQTEQIRARYFLAENRVADARAMVERALAGLKTRSGDPRRSTETGVVGWLEILADIEAGEGRSEKALEYYRATLPTIYLSMAVERQPRVAAIKRYYLANGGTEENWVAWAAQTVDLSSLLPPAH